MDIKNNKQIKKFCFYGFFKNLRFFEPYLFIYFMNNGLNFFLIGTLFSVREIIVYLFEIPSGVIADYFGKKNELMFCFMMYIISFIFFFIGQHYIIILIGMVFFGLGEAFRSGTHKAMIYAYLEKNNVFHLKNKVYGYTRSYSKMGSAISSFLSILIILNLKYYRTIFLFSIIPYILDFLLIRSYPDTLNDKSDIDFSFGILLKLMKKQVVSIVKNIRLNLVIINSSVYNSVYSALKDYIQPIIVGIMLMHIQSFSLSLDDMTKISLGLLYGFFSIGSVFVSRHSYKLNRYISSEKIMMYSFLLFGLSLNIISISIHFDWPIIVFVLFFLIYVSKDLRKVHFVEFAGNHMAKEERATVMSYNNQLKSTLLVVFSPIFGLVADVFSIQAMFIMISIALLMIYLVLVSYNKKIA